MKCENCGKGLLIWGKRNPVHAFNLSVWCQKGKSNPRGFYEKLRLTASPGCVLVWQEKIVQKSENFV